MIPIRIVIEGAPRTKKTSQRILRFGKFNKIVPSKVYLAWRDMALVQLRRQFADAPIDRPVNCAATFYRDALRGDAVGFYQGLADALQEGGVLIDDKWITQWDGSRLDKDAARPRVEIVLSEIA